MSVVLGQLDVLMRAHSLVRAFERENRVRFEHVVKLRDNEFVPSSLHLQPLLWMLDNDERDFIVNACPNGAGGLNDRIHVVRHAGGSKKQAAAVVFGRGQAAALYDGYLPSANESVAEWLLAKAAEVRRVSPLLVSPCDLPTQTLRRVDGDLCFDAATYKSDTCQFPDNVRVVARPCRASKGIVESSTLPHNIPVCKK
eukprot:TRINITY_DN4795_c0_g1_i2.p1 TRINITY_DN4795_c0_g1~~TRINITY_DN4795_c0_g1_i2.p1  ORF type:complete len:198 (-),score=68.73 TRINITY_DN4795_c0_g1_i2:40-633(-)